MTVRKFFSAILGGLVLFAIFMQLIFTPEFVDLGAALVVYFMSWLFYTSSVLLMGLWLKPVFSILLLFFLFSILSAETISLSFGGFLAYAAALYFMSRTLKRSGSGHEAGSPIFYTEEPNDESVRSAVKIGLYISFIPLFFFIVFLFLLTLPL